MNRRQSTVGPEAAASGISVDHDITLDDGFDWVNLFLILRTPKSPVLIGDPGIGKTAVVAEPLS